MKYLYINDLERLLDKELITEEVKLKIDILLIAVNDWPKSIDNLEDYEYEISKFINCKSTKKNILNSLKNIDFTQYAWQAESLTGLLDLFQYYKVELSLKEIIDELKNSNTFDF